MSLVKEVRPSLSELKYLVEKLFGVDFYKYMTGEVVLDKDQKQALDRAVKEYSTGRPLEYILEQAQFFGLDLKVDESVLIPRPETEVLVESLLDHIKLKKSLTLLDIGTGSGNIPVALSSHAPSLRIISVDISQQALRVAGENVYNYKCANVLLVRADILTCFKEDSFDIIVSNPPYVASSYIEDNSSLGFEPRLALDGGEEGMFFISKILDQASFYLKKDGRLFLEIGYDQSEKVTEYAKEKGWKVEKVVKDHAGIERVLIFELVTR